MSERIAIVVDSGSDVNDKVRGNLEIYRLPLRVIIDDKEYIDGKDISLAEVLDVLDNSKVTTSLPTGEDIQNTFDDLKAKGFTHVIAIAISSGLSGTYNIIRTVSEDYDGLEIAIFDTLNISLGSGFVAIKAAEMVENGASFKDVTTAIASLISQSKVFFTVGTLDYLIRGGRIGMVAGTVANVLNIKPVISCNENGIYHTVAKTRGYSRVIRKMIELAAHYASNAPSCRIEVLNAASKEDLDAIITAIGEAIPNAKSVGLSPITPALAIHTGPEALGIAVLLED